MNLIAIKSPTPTFSQLQNQAEQEFNHEKLSDSSSNLLMNKYVKYSLPINLRYFVQLFFLDK